jgi:hypothetical protein
MKRYSLEEMLEMIAQADRGCHLIVSWNTIKRISKSEAEAIIRTPEYVEKGIFESIKGKVYLTTKVYID